MIKICPPPTHKKILSVIACLAFGLLAHAQNQNPFFGLNAWMPNQIHNATLGGHYETILSSGVLSNNSSDLGARMMRFGGTTWDRQLIPTNSTGELDIFVSAAINKGLEPILQIPVVAGLIDHWNTPGNGSHSLATALASMLSPGSTYETYVNNFVTLIANDVTYYSIGNEPDIWGNAHSGAHTNFTGQNQDKNNNGHILIALYI